MGLSQIQLIPFSELAPGEVGAIRNGIIHKMVELAMQSAKLPEDQFVVRDIRALDDLGYTYEDWTEVTDATADQWETMASGTMGDQRWVGIFGVKADPDRFACTSIKFNVGGGDRVIWQLQSLREQDDMVGFCPSGIIIPQRTPYTISRYIRSASSPVSLVLKGVVVEKRGKVVSP